MALFHPDELVDIAMSVYTEDKAVSDVCNFQQHDFLFNNFGRQKYSTPENELS